MPPSKNCARAARAPQKRTTDGRLVRRKLVLAFCCTSEPGRVTTHPRTSFTDASNSQSLACSPPSYAACRLHG
eukprot:scaffold50_cov420-Prasinococcus_capsulatus_cf.AAC.43